MNQVQLDVILAIIKNGAPALANELCDAIMRLVKENDELKTKIKTIEEED